MKKGHGENRVFFTYLSYKKGKPKNFPPNAPLCFGKAFEDSQETFLEKFLVSGLGADAPTYNAQKKARQRRAF